jgi:hypothetical protein
MSFDCSAYQYKVPLSICENGKIYADFSFQGVEQKCGKLHVMQAGTEFKQNECKGKTTYKIASKLLNNNKTAIFFFVDNKLKKIL